MKMIPDDANIGIIPMEAARSMPALEIFHDMIAGRLPGAPIAKTLNFTLTKAEHGVVEFRGYPMPEFFNPLGTIHGGWAATILDSALGCAVHTTLPAGMAYTTIEFKVNLVRAITLNTGEVICTGKVIHAGRTTAVSEARLEDSSGKLLALGTETCAIFPIPAGG